ncbi:molybdate ABC transporter substrate-binding protein [uncultured Fusobacterium sp.]|jgi:molybdate transport system substrate-binding protein|uniref:molybdate ABC transporter substrate-binding protein n=1 Tax=Fusobacterium sp. HC1336 TaxID=3171169 RepID=UPI00195A8E8C|nr:molybdate ABC transporter substrate-binding protein [uncultured Fusobacterium sp.]MBM6689958.1 molybdate ABC transporter substrate-binding protein [Fusobacterium mortiferum]
MKKIILKTLIGMLTLSSLSFSKEEITVSAAASLKEVMGELTEKFQNENKDIKINLNLGGSGALKNQIVAGAPVDLVFFASQKDLKDLDSKGLIDKEYQKDILKNRLVVAGRSNIDSLDKLVGSSIAIGIPESVPAGKYSKEAFINYGIWDKVQKDIVYAKDVRSAAQYVDLYEVDYSLIYKTDARVLKNSEIVYTVPENLHTPIIYSYGVIKDRANENVVKLYNYLNSETAKKLYEKYGFEMAD